MEAINTKRGDVTSKDGDITFDAITENGYLKTWVVDIRNDMVI